MKIIVDKDVCIGCNMCGDITDGLMGTEYGKTGLAAAQNPKADLSNPKNLSKVKVAIEACPVHGIKLK